jgi:hypothetical protein
MRWWDTEDGYNARCAAWPQYESAQRILEDARWWVSGVDAEAAYVLGLPTVPSTGTAVEKAAVFPKSRTRDGTGRQKSGRKRGRDGGNPETGQI